jgi:hypothetical protein
MNLMQRTTLTVSLLAVSCALVWYAVCSNRIAATDFAFMKQHDSTELFPKALFYKGGQAYYTQLEPNKAIEYFRLSIVRDPLFIPAWLALAKVELTDGQPENARQIVDSLESLVAHVSTWKWQELLLAYDLRDDRRFAQCLNFILSRLPYRIPEAYYLAAKFWGDPGSVVPYVEAENRPALMVQLMRTKEVDASLALWQRMQDGASPLDQDLKLDFCQFLLASNRIAAAEGVWGSWLGKDQAGIYDGSFQYEPMDRAFGWRFKRSPQVSLRRTSETSFDGSHSLNLHFNGTSNVNFNHVSQIVSVESGRSYVLRFARRSRNLTTDQGIFLEVTGYQCKGLNATSEPIAGTTSWSVEELRFAVPEGCEAVTVRLRRKESLMFDNKILGDYWLDAVSLEPQPLA